MRDLVLLYRVQFLSLLNSLAPRGRDGMTKGARTRRLVLIVAGVCLIIAIFESYLVAFGISFAAVGLAGAIPALAMVIGSLAGVWFAFMKANGNLFGLHDFDLVMSLPVSRRSVVATRLGALFSMAILTALIFMIPLYIIYFLNVGADPWTVLVAIASIVLAPMAPTSIGVFLAFGITAIASRFRHASLAYIVIALACILALFWGSLWFSSFSYSMSSEQTAGAVSGIATMIRDSATSFWPPAAWVSAALDSGHVLPFLYFAVFSIAVSALCLEIMQRCYLQINGLLAARASSHMSAKKLRLATGTQAAPVKAMAIKEIRCIIGIPYYAFQCLSGYLFMIALSVAIAVLGVRGTIVMIAPSTNGADQMLDLFFSFVPWVFAFLSITCCSAACAVSMEGRSAWVMSSAPVPVSTVLASKLVAGAVPLIATLLIGALTLLITGQENPFGALQVPVLGFGLFYTAVNVAMALDARRPNYAWSAPAEVVKRGLPIMVCTLGGMVLVFGGAFLAWVLMSTFGVWTGGVYNLVVGILGMAVGQAIFTHTSRHARLYIS
ncbi:hypothetical protein Corgl_1583 [Coriobacterium glomerans PW2]|uniref:Uncharacterized protein n=1 Tax=Coriobacterium glomerans (strain ATCC 49209 / DSM 20642 / JCM 10262 / PW2) TaxID=700015 RepID=F2NB04_CORGP|nr:hypothetical protein [Coriobacterium glomerans]AEB07682.1 hypothetical protein Corgl_1583 [Coriobacterium glomerans PW2]